MAKRRGNNEGTVFQDKDGVWWAQLPPDEQGRRPKRRAKTQREAQEKLRQMERDREQGLNLTAKQPTVAQFAETWLEQVKRRTVKASTHESYHYVLDHYVLPHIGAVRLDKLTTPRVQKLINDLDDGGYQPETIWNAYRRLRSMLDVAVQYRLVPYNVAAHVVLPKIKVGEQRALSAEDARALLAAFAQHRLGLLFTTILCLGLRRGEGLGLAWKDLNWEAHTIAVTQQVRLVGGKNELTTPKTERSARTLPLPPHLYERLQAHEEQQQIEKAWRGDAWQEHGLLFPSEIGTPLSPRNVVRAFTDTQKEAKLDPVTLHDLRHTCATLLGDREASDRVIGAILGHAPDNVTQRYARATLAAMREALDGLEALLLKEGK